MLIYPPKSTQPIIGNPTIEAYVIGKEFSEKVESQTKVGSPERGRITICTFDQLVATAEKRIFGLRTRLSERYDDIPGMELFKKARKTNESRFYHKRNEQLNIEKKKCLNNKTQNTSKAGTMIT